MPTARYKNLVEKAIEAGLAAVEIYNKPNIKYREETFSILMLNAWELILKARLLQHYRKLESIHVYEPIRKKEGSKSHRKQKKLNRSGNPMTINLQRAMNEVKQLPTNRIDENCQNNLLLLQEIRDNSVHYHDVSGELRKRIHEVGAAALRNFVDAVDIWFDIDLKRYNFNLTPLSPYPTSIVAESLGGRKEPVYIRRLLEKISEMELEHSEDSNQRFAVTVQVRVKFLRSHREQSIPVKLTNDDPNAIPIKTNEEDILKNFPWSYQDLYRQLKSRYTDFKANSDFHKMRKTIVEDNKYCRTRYLDPNRKSSSSKKTFYSSGILSEFDKHYHRKDS